MVKLFKYPCVVEKAKFNEYCGHSSHVTKVRFSSNDHFVVSTGGNDMTVMIWQTDLHEQLPLNIEEEEVKEIEYTSSPDDLEFEVKVDRARE